eukprot:m.433669 g.433669  ORF g.433669 m.433669 type:complete len:2065 (-) comp20251_c1_seq2:318-6512(-)
MQAPVAFVAAVVVLCSTIGPAQAQCDQGEYYRSRSCRWCFSGVYQDAENHRISSCKPCERGKYQDQWRQASCKPCNAGRFSNQEERTSCQVCGAGTYTPNDGGAYAQCLACPKGTFNDIPYATSCVVCDNGEYANQEESTSCKVCPKGTVSANDGLPHPGCDACVAGSYMDETGGASCKICDNGLYMNQEEATVPCKTCTAGFYSANDGLPHPECDHCPVGKYSDKDRASSCKSCAPGFYQDETAQSGCKACDKGKYTDTAEQSECVPVSGSCGLGEYYSAASPSSNRQCIACPAGKVQPANDHTIESCISCQARSTYQNIEGQTACLSVTTSCPVGQGVASVATPSQDYVCAPCVARESYSGTDDLTACKPVTKCPPGTQANLSTVSLTSDWSCEPCPEETFQATEADGDARCEDATTCRSFDRETLALLPSQDRGCTGIFDCVDGLDVFGDPCSCNANCNSCEFQRDVSSTAGTVMLVRREEQPQRFSSLGSCTSGLTGSASEKVDACAARCFAATECVSFLVYTSGQSDGDCCLHSFYSIDLGFQTAPGGHYFEVAPCAVCADGFFLDQDTGRCRTADDLPVFETTPPDMVMALSSDLNIDLGAVTATTSTGPVSFSVRTSFSPRRAFDVVDGKLTYVQQLDAGGSGTITIVARDARTSCFYEDSDGNVVSEDEPCETTVTIALTVAFYLDCPSGINAFIDPGVASAPVNFDPPTVPAVFADKGVTLTSATSSGDTFPRGTTTVTYQSQPLAGGQRLVCRFDVVLDQGFQIPVTTIGHTMSTVATDFLIDQSQGAGGGSKLAAFTGDLTSSLTITVQSPPGHPFTTHVPEGTVGSLALLLQYCSAGEFPEDSDPTVAAASAQVLFVGSSHDTLYFDTTAHVTSDLRCFRIAAETPSFDSAFEFVSLEVQIAEPVGIRRRRAAGDEQLYQPLLPSVVAMQLANATNGSALASDPGPIVTLEDNEAPLWLGCPDEMVEMAAPQAVDAVVTWNAPTAVDNVAVTSESSSHAPGVSLSIVESPHTIVYEASDGRQSSTCSFDVHVSYAPTTLDVALPVDEAFDVMTTVSSVLDMTIVDEQILTAGKDVTTSLSADLSVYNNLQLRITPPAGDRLAIRDADAATQQLYVSLRWVVTGGAGSLEADGDVAVRFVLEDLEIDSASCETPPPEGETLFPSATAHIDPTDGSIEMLASSAPFHGCAFSFESLLVRLAYPAGRSTATAGSQSYNLTATSFVSVRSFFQYDAEQDAPDATVSRQNALFVQDTEAPVFQLWPVYTAPVATDAGVAFATVTWTEPAVSDNRGAPTLTSDFASGSTFALRDEAHVVTYTASDEAGNTATQNFSFFIEDLEPPTVTCPASLTLNVSEAFGHVDMPSSAWAPVATADNSGIAPVVVAPTGAFKRVVVGANDVVVVVRDAAGNEANCTFEVTVEDWYEPEINCPVVNPSTQTRTDGANVSWAFPVVTDNHRVSDVVFSHGSGGVFPVGVTNVSVLATDLSNNEASCMFQVEVLANAAFSPSTGSSSANVPAMAAGGAVGCLFLALIAVVYVKYARARAASKRPVNFEELFEFLNAMKGEANVPREIKREHVTILQELGKGAFGVVAKAKLREIPAQPGYLVAVKQLHEQAGGTERTELLEEAAVMAQFQHPNVVSLLGVVTVGDPTMVVLEFMEFGALNEYLRKKIVPEPQKILFASQCAAGLEHIHSKGFVHRDVAARNVLVSSEVVCKIADFGLARDEGDDTYYRSSGGQLPIRWTAPEALEGRRFDESTDVWSYGILVQEIFTDGATPYQGMTNNKVWVAVQAGHRMPKAVGCPDEIYELLTDTWKEEPMERPRFFELSKRLQLMAASPDGYVDVMPMPGTGTSSAECMDHYDLGAAEPEARSQPSADPMEEYDFGFADEDVLTIGTPVVREEVDATALYDLGFSGDAPAAAPAAQVSETALNDIYDLGSNNDAGSALAAPATLSPTTSSSTLKPLVTADDIGQRVTVEGYGCGGTLRFFGKHAIQPGLRCGVELDLPEGRNNGTVSGHKYFECQENHGLLCAPRKVRLAYDGWLPGVTRLNALP